MNKKEFLKNLERELKKRNCEDVKEILDYYEEIIDERVSEGKEESKVIKDIGSIENIMKELDIKEKIEKANRKPSMSNGMKALIACLGIMSFPISLPIIIVLLTLMFVFAVLIVSFIITFVAVSFSMFIGTIVLLTKLFTGEISIISSMFAIGIFLIISSFSIWIFHYLRILLNRFINYIYTFINNKLRRKK